jgi:hypothetical protein
MSQQFNCLIDQVKMSFFCKNEAKRLEKEWEMMLNPFPKLEKHFS